MAPLFGERSITPERLWWGLAVGVLLVFAFGLRIWGVDHGLPYAYNADENAHFVTRAIGLFGHGWDPQYYVNPPAYTYLAHLAAGRLVRRPRGRLERVRRRPDADLDPHARPRRGPRDARDLADLPRRLAARRPPRRPARRRDLHGRLPAGLLLEARAQRRADARAAVPRAVGDRRASCASAAGATTSSRASASAWRARRSTPAASCSLPLVAAAVVQFTAPGRALGRRARDRDRRRRGAARVPRRQPVRGPQLGRVRQRPDAPVRRVGRRGRQARADAGQRLPLLPVVASAGGSAGSRCSSPSAAPCGCGSTSGGCSGSSSRRCSCSCSSWARRSATSGAGSCRSSRSSASSRRTRRSSSSTSASATRRR